MSIPKFILATAAVCSLAFVTGGAAGASSATRPAHDALDELCEQRGGLPVNTPYAIARCQGARANKGFEIERLACESDGDAAFSVAISTRHKNRATWTCVAISPTA